MPRWQNRRKERRAEGEQEQNHRRAGTPDNYLTAPSHPLNLIQGSALPAPPPGDSSSHRSRPRWLLSELVRLRRVARGGPVRVRPGGVR